MAIDISIGVVIGIVIGIGIASYCFYTVTAPPPLGLALQSKDSQGSPQCRPPHTRRDEGSLSDDAIKEQPG